MVKIDRSNVEDIFGLSMSQKSMLFHYLKDEEGNQFNIQIALKIEGEVDIDLLVRSVRHVQSGNEILRSIFNWQIEAKPLQIVLKDIPLEISTEDWSDRNNEHLSLLMALYLEEDRKRRFDLNSLPIRVGIIRLPLNACLMHVTHHQMLYDGWSTGIFMREIFSAYDQLRQKKSADFPVKPSYKEIQKAIKARAGEGSGAQYWLAYLEDYEVTNLSSGGLDQQEKERLKTISVIEKDLDLSSFSAKHKVTPASVVYAAYGLLLQKYLDTPDIVFGTVVSYRDGGMRGAEEVMGNFINTIPLRIRANTEGSLLDTIAGVHGDLIRRNAYNHSSYFEIRQVLGFQPNEYLFDSVVVIENYPLDKNIRNKERAYQVKVQSVYENAGIPLHVAVFFEEGIRIDLTYDLSLISDELATALAYHLPEIIKAMVKDPSGLAMAVSILTEKERQDILYQFNNTRVDYPKEETLAGLFERQVEKTPFARAIFSASESFTYKALNERVNRLTHFLIQKGIGREDVVGVLMTRSIDFVINIFAIIKAGALYMPIDPGYPDDRVNYILESSRAALLLTRKGVAEKREITAGMPVLYYDALEPELARLAVSDPEVGAAENIHVIYTSGSTGVPKGVVGTQKGLLNRLRWGWDNYPVQGEEVFCLKTNIGFTDHVAEVFSPLLSGIPVRVFSEEEILDIPNLNSLLIRDKITRITLVPSYLKALIELKREQEPADHSLRYVFCSGEYLPFQLARRFYMEFSDVLLVNIYGSTEVSADATYYNVDRYYVEDVLKYFRKYADLSDNITFPDVSIEELTAGFRNITISDYPAGVEEYLSEFRKKVLPYSVNTGSPRFIGHMTSLLPDYVHDLSKLISRLNQNLVKIETSKSLTFIEREAIAMLHRVFYVFPEAFYREHIQKLNSNLGIITSGGSTANISALLSARNKLLYKDGSVGSKSIHQMLLEGGYKDMVLIGSRLMHYSFRKAMSVLGLGTDNILYVESNAEGNIKIEDLRRKIQDCREQNLLILGIIGIAGATETGNIDPLRAMGEIALRNDIHFHVDAAWGGLLQFSDKYSRLLDGIELADSITFCGHKQLFLPQGISVCLFKDPQQLNYNSTVANYQASAGSYDFGRVTIEGSKPGLSLCLHASLRILGKKGYALLLDRGIKLANRLAGIIRGASGMEFISIHINIVNYRYIPEIYRGRDVSGLSSQDKEYIDEVNTRIQEAQFLKGRTFVSKTKIRRGVDEPIVVFRAVLSNPLTTYQDLEYVIRDQFLVIQELFGEKNSLDPSASPETAIQENGEETERDRKIPIGKPISNTIVLIVDGNNELQPVGVPGEMLVGGDGVARGYLNNEPLSREKFIHHPSCPGQRFYRTGDLARWLPDGNIEFLGRRDSQVKIRGHRIELGEIESHLGNFPGIKDVVVQVLERKGEKYLAGYYVADRDIPAEDLQVWLSHRLPDYMAPAHYIRLDFMPMTASGKRDRKRLPDPGDPADTHYVAPADELQGQLVEIWSEILSLEKERISVGENFFKLGGHSLRAIALVHRIHKQLGAVVPLNEVFKKPSIAQLSEYIKALQKVAYSPIPTAVEKAYYQLSSSQKRLYFLYEMDRSTLAYNAHLSIKFGEKPDKERIRAAVASLVLRHESLRTVFRMENDVVVQVIIPPFEFDIAVYDSGVSEAEMVARFRKPFDLSRPPLFRICIYKDLSKGYTVLIDMHHIIADRASFDILRSELHELYLGNSLAALRRQYKDYSEWQNSPAFRDLVRNQEAYWINLLRDKLPVLKLPADLPGDKRSGDEGGIINVYLDPAKIERIRAYCHAQDVTMSMLLYSLFSILLSKLSGQEEMIIGLSVSGRSHSDLSGIVGMFVNALAIRSFPAKDKLLKEFIQEIKAATISAYENQDCQFDSLVEKLQVQRDSGRNPIFDVMLNFLGRVEEEIDFSREQTEGYEYFPWTRRFDLTLNVTEYNNSLQIQLQYDSGLFSSSTAERMSRYFVHIVSVFCDKGTERLSDIDIEGEETIRRIFGELDDEASWSGSLQSPVLASYHQERLWFIDRFESGYLYEKGPVYHNIPLILTLSGRLDVIILEKSIRYLIKKYAILRTCIKSVHDVPYQTIIDDHDFGFQLERGIVDEEEIIKKAFELDGPLLRAGLLEPGKDEYRLVLVIHHIIIDRYSISRLAGEILSTYRSYLLGEHPATARGAFLKYADFAEWQRNRLAVLEPYFLSYWKQQLGVRLKNLELPTDRPRAAVHTYTGASSELSIPEKLAERLYGYEREAGIPVGVLLMAAFKIILFHYCRHEEIVIGTSIDNREGEGVEDLIGPVSNLIVLRSFIKAGDTFAEYVSSLHRIYLSGKKYGAMPFDKLVKELAPEKDMSRTALFDVCYQMEDKPLGLPRTEGLEAGMLDLNYGYGKYDLNLFLERDGRNISGRMVFNLDYFDPSTVESLLSHYIELTGNLLEEPGRPISEIEYLSRQQTDQLLHEFDNTQVGYPEDKTIIDLFRDQVKQRPGNIAVKDGGREIRYDELDRRSTGLAFVLKGKGVTSDVTVGLLTARSIETVIGILAILKAGGAYVPIDIEYPRDRKEYIAQNSGAKLLVTTRDLTIDFGDGMEKIFIGEASDGEPADGDLGYDIKPSDLCYIIYTSGTTGNPKGVMVEHRNVVRLFFNDAFQFSFGAGDVWTLFHSHCFDFSVWEIFGALLFGGKLIIIPKMIARDTEAYLAVLKKESVTVLNQTPSAFYSLIREELACPDACLALRYIIFGGEALSPGKLKRWRAKYPESRLINMYGITETTVHVTYKELGEYEIDNNISSIGKPIPTLSAYVFDDRFRLLPHGVIGELYVGGAGVSRGYWGNKELTDKRFIPNPYDSTQRLYRSGDLVRVLNSGDIEYLGRSDNQIQLRGFRIELGEIETRLTGHPGIKEAAVIDKGKEGNKFLVAYYVAEEEMGTAEMRAFLSDKLPDYMIPSFYVQLTRLPLTNNGKLDRNALPEPGVRREDKYITPETKEEKLLADIWSEVLGGKHIGVTSNFFVLGGDSIRSIQISSRLRAAGYKISVKDIFTNQTIRELALKIKKIKGEQEQEIVIGEVPLTAIQEWFFKNHPVGWHHYNHSVLLHFPQGISAEEARLLVTRIQAHHDALRMSYRLVGEGVSQYNHGTDHPVEISEWDLSGAGSFPENWLSLCNEIQSSIDPSQGPLLKAGLFQMGGGSRLLIVIHHLVVDGISWRILFEDIDTLYRQMKAGQALQLPMKTDSFQSWSERLRREYVGSRQYKEAIDYWNAVLSAEKINMTRSVPSGSNTVRDTVSSGFRLDKAFTGQLLGEVHGRFNTGVNDLLLAGLLMAVNRTYGARPLGLDLEGHGREDILEGMDVSRTIGWFTSIFPVVLEQSGEGLSGLIRSVKETLRAVPHHGIDYLIGRYLTGDIRHKGSSQILFNYLGQFGSDTEGKAFFITDEATGDIVSPSATRIYDWEVSGLVRGGQLEMRIAYSGRQYDKTLMDALMVSYESGLKELISYCLRTGKQEKTPSDLTYKKLSLAGLKELQDKYDLEDVYPLSPLQEGMIYHYLLDGSADHYFVQACYRVTGGLNIEIAERSLAAIVNRYDVLRTIFLHSGYERALQVVLRSADGAFTYKDIREEARETGREAAVEKYRRSDRGQKFRLHEGMLIRAGIYRTGEEDYEFIWSFHHILMDGWCLGILVSQFNDLYKGYLEARELVLPAVRPYSDYISWLEGRDKEKSLDYWRDYLSGYRSLASIPVDVARAGERGFSPMTQRLVLDRRQTGALRKIGGKYGVTMNTLLQSAWGILLARYNNVRDVVFGAVVSGRPAELPGVEQMVGLFINTIPVRIGYEEEESLSDLVRRVQERASEGESYHYSSLPEIQSVAGTGILFDHILVFENYPIAERVEGLRSSEKGSYRVSDLKIVEQTNYDLTLIIGPGEEVSIEFLYNACRYEPAGIRRLTGHLAEIIGQMEKGMELPVGRVDMLKAEERDELVYAFNATATDSPEEQTVIDLFESQVRRTPGSLAVKFGNISITYEALKEKADRIANYLQQEEGVKAGDRVGLLLDRELELLPAIFGIMKSGAVYVPLSTNNPAARLRYILKDSGLKALITRRHYIDALSIEMDAGLLDLDRSMEKINARGQMVLDDVPRGKDVAYIIYTSGSTGKPKGVMIEHGSLLNLVRYMDRSYPLLEGDKYLLKTNIAFDVSLIELFGWFSCGGCVTVLSPDSEKDPRMIIDHIAAESNTHVNFVPSMFSEFVKVLEDHSIGKIRSLKYIMLAGEALPAELVQRFQQLNTGVSLANIYGPTEGTIYSCGFSIPEGYRSPVIPIGKPIDNVRLYILDDSFRLVPKGVTGELYIAGAGVARGYLNNEELNKDKFISSPFLPGERIYRTGDRVSWLADGNVQYLGRKDHQVKIRGYRIELGEIERALAGYEGITDAAVVLHEKGGQPYLAGYYMSERDIPYGELRSYLSQYLPDYMLPGYFQRMNAFPLTTSGKVDRNLFPHPELTAQQAYMAPAGRTEKILSKLWGEILKIDEQAIGVHASFFELGGHSIRAIQLANKIQDVFSVQIGLRHLFGMNTIAEQALLIEGSRPDGKKGIPKADQKPYYPVSPAQERMYYRYLLDPGDTGRNISVAIELGEAVNIQALEAAFRQLIDRHSGLRTSFELSKGAVVQKINPAIVFEWKSLTRGEDEPLKDCFSNFIQPFDLSKAPLVRAAVVREAAAGYLFIDIHHIICDGSSMNVLVRDLRDLYWGKSLPALELEYVDYAEWVRKGIENEEIHRNYWANKLSGNVRRMNLPVLQDRELVQRGAVNQLGLPVEGDLYKRIKLFLREADVSDFMFFLSISYIMLYKITGDQDIVIGTDGIGRNSKLPEAMVGTFVNILPLRMEIEGKSSYTRFLYGVKECVLEAIEHQEYPYDRIVALLKAEDRQLVDVHFSFDNTFDSSAEMAALQFRSVDLGRDARWSEYDISIEVREKEEGFQILFLYNRVLYDEDTIRIFLDIFRKILDAVMDNEKTGIDKIAVSTAMII